MTTEFREVISHCDDMGCGIRMLMAIAPAMDDREGGVAIKLQWMFGKNKYDTDSESIAYLSCASIGKLLLILDGCEKGATDIEAGNDTRVFFMRRRLDGLYRLKIYSSDSVRQIALHLHEAEIFKEILRTTLFRIVFG